MRHYRRLFSPNAESGILTPAAPTILQGEALRRAIEPQAVDGVMYQAAGRRTSVDDSKMSATFTVLTTLEEPNRHGNRVHVSGNKYGQGFRTEAWKRNPIVYFEHGWADPKPIGTAEDKDGRVHIEGTTDTLSSTVFFHDLTQTAADVFKLVRANVIRMASVGFQPELALPLKLAQQAEEDRAGGAFRLTYPNLEFFQCEMTEWSVTALGADRGAMRQTFDRRKAEGEKIGGEMLAWLSVHAEPRQTQGIGWTPPQQQAAGGQIPIQLTVRIEDGRAGASVQGNTTGQEGVSGPATPASQTAPVVSQSAASVMETMQGGTAEAGAVPQGTATVVIPSLALPNGPPNLVADFGMMMGQQMANVMQGFVQQQQVQQTETLQAINGLADAVRRGMGTF